MRILNWKYQIYVIFNQINTKRDKILKHPKIVQHFLEQSNFFLPSFWISHHSVGIDSFCGIMFNSILAKITNFLYFQTTSQGNSEKSEKIEESFIFSDDRFFGAIFWIFQSKWRKDIAVLQLIIRRNRRFYTRQHVLHRLQSQIQFSIQRFSSQKRRFHLHNHQFSTFHIATLSR